MDFKEKLNSEAVKVVCFGDSVTGGYFESSETMHATLDTEAVFHFRLKKKLNTFFPQLNLDMINSGVGGDTAFAALDRIDTDVLKHKPDLVIVSFGLNDVNGSEEEFTSALDKVFRILKEADIETIYLSPNMLNTRISDKLQKGALYDYACKTMEYQLSGRMDNFVNAALLAARNRDIIICDCYKKWKKLYELGADTTNLLANYINHPTREMHSLFTDSLLDTILFN